MPDTFIHLRQRPTQGVVLALFGPEPPALGEALPLAERVRAALMHGGEGPIPWQISGKDPQGRPRRGHDHLYILPYSSAAAAAGRLRLDRVLLWAKHGFEADTLEIVDRLACGGGWIGGAWGPRLRLEALERGNGAQLGKRDPALLLGPARAWRSATPFLPPRHGKRRGGVMQESPAQQLRRLCELVLGQAPTELEVLPAQQQPCAAFVHRRSKDQRPPDRRLAHWRLRFAEPVSGPIALGYGAHQGLGRFEVEDTP